MAAGRFITGRSEGVEDDEGSEDGGGEDEDFKSSRLYTRSVMKAQSFCGGGGAVWLHVECVVLLGEADGETFQQDVNCTIMVMCG